MLEARDITVGYDADVIVREVSLNAAPGEILVVLGANGAGKTTVLRALNGALPLRAGEIRLGGKSLEKYSRREIANAIAVVAQETEIKFPISVLEFVLSGRFAAARSGGAFGWETASDAAIARRALSETDLNGFENRLLGRLSGGERQRAVFARALASEAKTFLLDEPTANLDLSHQASLLKVIRQKCDRENCAAIVITHDLNLAAQFANRILLLGNGETIAQGEPAQVLTAANLRRAFAVDVVVDRHPANRERLRVTTIYQ